MLMITEDPAAVRDSNSAAPYRLDVLQTVVEASDQGFLVVTPESTALDCNQQFLDLWGIPAALATDNASMMQYVLDSLEHPDAFVDKIIAINRDPDAAIRDEVLLKDGRIIERFSQPCNRRHKLIHRVWCFRDVTEQRRAELEIHRQQQQIQEQQKRMIHLQQTALAELSTPLIPITRDVMVMPLIGTIDSARASSIMESLLEGVAASQSTTVIMDITGVHVVDTQVANALIQAASAVRLLGARVCITGISPRIAQTLVGLGLGTLQGIKTYSTLEEAISQTFNLAPSAPDRRVPNLPR